MEYQDFIKIEDYKNDITRIIGEINVKCEKLDATYIQYLKQATSNPEYIISLDTLFFQLYLTKQDINNYNTLFNTYIYQMYGQYYKFYKKIIHNLEDVNTSKIFKDFEYSKNFAPFDDINFKMYSFEEILSIHTLIISIINCINNYISKQGYEIEDDVIRVNKGVSIDTLVFEKKHSITILENKVKLYNSILTKYYEYQKKVSRRIMLKLKLLYFQIDNDVQFESFNYSSRQSITPEVDAKLKSVIKIRDFENIILDEFEDKTNCSSPIKSTINRSNNVFKLIFDGLIKKILTICKFVILIR